MELFLKNQKFSGKYRKINSLRVKDPSQNYTGKKGINKIYSKVSTVHL
jgi:hypothetical protein